MWFAALLLAHAAAGVAPNAAGAPTAPAPCTADEDCLSTNLRCLPSPGGAPCTLDYAFNETGTCACLPQGCDTFTYASATPGKKQWLVVGDSISMGYYGPLSAALKAGWDVYHVGSRGKPINCDNAVRYPRASFSPPLRNPHPLPCPPLQYFASRCVKGWLGADAARWDVVSYNAGLHDLAFPDNEHLAAASYAQYLGDTLRFLAGALRPSAALLWLTTTPVPTDPPANCTLLPGRLESSVREYNAAAAAVVASVGAARAVRTCDLHAVITRYCGDSYATCNITQCAGPHFSSEGFALLGGAVAGCGTA